MAIILTQLPLIFFFGGKFDLLFGFNQTHAGFAALLVLFVSVPLLNLFWLVTEISLSVKHAKHGVRAVSMIIPIIALVFLMESIGIDLYLLSQARM
jgi:uncharacterized protein involved in cysteine biosynthesis